MPGGKETVRVNVSPAILSWALSMPTLMDVNEKFPQVDQWVSGAKKPTLKQLRDFSKATNIPFGYFFLETPPAIPLPVTLFRSVDGAGGQPSAELRDTLFAMRRRQLWLHEYLANIAEPLPFVGSAKHKTNVLEIASEIRTALGLANGWASSVRTFTEAQKEVVTNCEKLGIFVFANGIVGNNTHRPLNSKEFRGFVLVDEYAPLIFINKKDSKAAQNFTIMHEVAHIWLGKSAAFDLRNLQPANDPVERLCDQIAAEILVPAQEIKRLWNSERLVDFETLAKHFKCSQIVAARRLLDLGLINQVLFSKFYQDYIAQEFEDNASDDGGGTFWNNTSSRVGLLFSKVVERAVKENKLLYREAFKLTDLHGDTFAKFFDPSLRED